MDRTALRADCAQCVGLCCVALTLTVSADFAIDKPAGEPCPNLEPDFRCGIHSSLRERGFPGCTVYDCFGAGQKVTRQTFGSLDWRQAPDHGALMFEVFAVMRLLHELLWYLTEALELEVAPHAELAALAEETERLTDGSADDLAQLDVVGHRARVNEQLLRTSKQVRSRAMHKHPKGWDLTGADLRGKDFVGAELRGRDLRAANLRSAYLIAADLRDADLSYADLIGADLRDTDLRGARLEHALFLTQMQVNAAKGDAGTTLPPRLDRPSHWP